MARYALLIGNTDYDDQALRQLKAPDADVRALAELLQTPDIGGYHIQILSNEPSHKVQRAIGKFLTERHPDDLALLYFTGHGVLDPQGRLWLALKDTEKDLPTATGLGAAWLKDQMDNSRARRQVLLLDCCYSGAFSTGAKGNEALNRPAVLDDTFGEKGRGRVVLAATDKTSAAWEGERIIGGLELSLFTHFVIQGIRTGAAADGQGRVTPGTLYEYVYREMAAATEKQRPRQIVYDGEGEIVIAQRPAASALPADLLANLNSPQVYVRAAAVGELARLLHGSDQKVARAAREKLEQIRADDDQPHRVHQAAVDALTPVDDKRQPAEQAARLAAEREALARTVHEAKEAASNQAVLLKRQLSPLALTLAPNVVIELARIPAGVFIMGSDKSKDEEADDGEVPQYKLTLPEYLIGKTPVTMAQFAAFVKATDYKWSSTDVESKAMHPVTNVTWRDAIAFCEWASQVTGQHVALPSEAEWEKAARGTDGRLFPWGNDKPTDKHCNFGIKVDGTTPVGQFSPLGDSPYGCVDMSGNVREWCRSKFAHYPYKPGDGREDLAQDARRVVRGGSFTINRRSVRCAFRSHGAPDGRDDYLGFRVVVCPTAGPA